MFRSWRAMRPDVARDVLGLPTPVPLRAVTVGVRGALRAGRQPSVYEALGGPDDRALAGPIGVTPGQPGLGRVLHQAVKPPLPRCHRRWPRPDAS